MQIILAHPRIPQNAGAVARLAAATRTRLVLARPLGFRVDAAAVRRAGLDYWEEARVDVAPSLEAALESAPGGVYFFSSHAARSYLDARFQADDTLVFGEEGQGLPPDVLAAVPPDRQLRNGLVRNGTPTGGAACGRGRPRSRKPHRDLWEKLRCAIHEPSTPFSGQLP
ncbi:MAG: tRNA (cytidine(34)-2'-O)-methyltransferase [Candidatus Sumerlaeota bacterium]|nr:tRNA (cytidine(34)-2'-O)-methyltransferase [Candidatus Sumerlaeota bacterium]